MPSFRRLTPDDRPAISDHLIGLEPEARRLRFGGPLKDAAIHTYVARLDFDAGMLFGYFEAGELRALAELFPGTDHAEAAFSVDRAWRGQGLCTDLVQAVLTHAGDAGHARVLLYIQQANQPMRRVAGRSGFQIRPCDGDLLAERLVTPAAA